jgi:hypothetical protein
MHLHQRHIFAELDLLNATACFAFQSRHRYQGSVFIINSSCQQLLSQLQQQLFVLQQHKQQSVQQLHNSHHKHKAAQAAAQTQHST